jgi:flagellar biosynthesis GTPase FlhF
MFGGRVIKNIFGIIDMTFKGFIKKTLLLFLALFMFFSSACSSEESENKSQGKKLSTEGQDDRVPELLEEIEKSIEKIIKTLDGPSIGIDEDERTDSEANQAKPKVTQDTNQIEEKGGSEDKEQDENSESKQGNNENATKKQDQKSDENQDQQAGQDKQQEKQQEPEEQQGQQQEQQGQTSEEDPWQQITPIINGLHYKWNSFLPMAMKKSANMHLIDGFSNALNNLTNIIIDKNKTNTLMASSSLYSYIPQFYSLYRSEISPELKKIRYSTRNSMLNAMAGNWEQAEYDLNTLQSSWSVFKNTLPEDMQESSSMLEFSIFEFEKVLLKKNQPLIDIKARVTMSNIETLEKLLKTHTGGERP